MIPWMSGAYRLLDSVIGWRLVIVWLALIFALSSIPNNFGATEDTLPVDKVVHVFEFGGLAFLLTWIGLRARERAHDGRFAAFVGAGAVVLALAYGVTDELHQRFVPGRDPSWADFGADALGAVTGALAAVTLSLRRGRTPTGGQQ